MPSQKEIKYLELTMQFAKSFSKDESTQVGAMFLHPTEYTILTAGYNGIPRGCDDNAPERHARPLKYEYFEHAERNGIYNAVRNIFRGGIAVCTAKLFIEDIRALISVGISEIQTENLPESATVRALLLESGVKVSPLPKDAKNNSLSIFGESTLNPIVEVEGEDSSGAPDEADYSAVRKAIFEVARPILENSTLVVGPMPPCVSCARAVAAVGVKRVITYEPSSEVNERWGKSFEQTRQVFSDKEIVMLEI